MSHATRIAAIADLHLAPADEPPRRYHGEWDLAGAGERLAQSLRIAQETVPALLTVLGDISQRGDAQTTADALRAITASNVPARLVAGNHDCAQDLDTLPHALRQIARPDLRLATAASERLASSLAIAGVTLHGEGDTFTGSLDSSRWPRHPVVLLSHFPLLSRREQLQAHRLAYPGDLVNHAQLASELQAREAPTIALTAHLHVRDTCTRGPLLQLSCAAQIEAPHEATIVEIANDDRALSVRRRSIPLGSVSAPATVLAPADETWAYRDQAWARCTPP
jgi:hypothetical protein